MARPDGIVVRTLDSADRNGILMSGSGETNLILDPEIWESHIGEEFRMRSDEYLTMKAAWDSGCNHEALKKGIEAVSERLVALRGLIVVASMDSTSKSRSLPDIGTVVSVGEKHSDKYNVGDHVTLRPGDMYLEHEGSSYRCLKDQYNPHTGAFLYDVTDSVPMVLTETGAEPKGEWSLAKRVQAEYAIQISTEVYTDIAEVDGCEWFYKAEPGDRLTFVFPNDWGLTKDHCLLHSRCMVAKEV